MIYPSVIAILLLGLGPAIGFAQTTPERASKCLRRVLGQLALNGKHTGDASIREAITKDFEDRIIAKLEKMPPKARVEALASLDGVRVNNKEFNAKSPGTLGFMKPDDLRIRLRKAASEGKIISLMYLGHEFDHIDFFARRKNMNPVLRGIDAAYHPIDKHIRTEFQAHGFQYDVVKGMFKAAGNPKEFFRFVMQELGISEADAHDMATLLEVMRVKGKNASMITDPTELARLTSDKDRFVQILQSGKLQELMNKVVKLMNDNVGIAISAQINSASRNQFVMSSLWANGYIKKYGVQQAIQFLSVTFAVYWVMKNLAQPDDDDAKKKRLPQGGVTHRRRSRFRTGLLEKS